MEPGWQRFCEEVGWGLTRKRSKKHGLQGDAGQKSRMNSRWVSTKEQGFKIASPNDIERLVNTIPARLLNPQTRQIMTLRRFYRGESAHLLLFIIRDSAMRIPGMIPSLASPSNLHTHSHSSHSTPRFLCTRLVLGLNITSSRCLRLGSAEPFLT